MNRDLKQYQTDVNFPAVSGIELLNMLYIRDRLAADESNLSKAEKLSLAAADKRLLEQAPTFYVELSRFVDLAHERQQRQISPARWWWYLDVLAQLPADSVVSATVSVTA